MPTKLKYDWPSADILRAALQQANAARAARGMRGIQRFQMANAEPDQPTGCLVACSVRTSKDGEAVWVGVDYGANGDGPRQQALNFDHDPEAAEAAQAVAEAWGVEVQRRWSHWRVPFPPELNEIANAFDSCDGQPGRLASLREAMRRAGVHL